MTIKYKINKQLLLLRFIIICSMVLVATHGQPKGALLQLSTENVSRRKGLIHCQGTMW